MAAMFFGSIFPIYNKIVYFSPASLYVEFGVDSHITIIYIRQISRKYIMDFSVQEAFL